MAGEKWVTLMDSKPSLLNAIVMRKSSLLFIPVFAIGVFCAFAFKSHSARLPLVYKGSSLSCVRAQLPGQCTAQGSTVCTISGVTYYLNSTCTEVDLYNAR